MNSSLLLLFFFFSFVFLACADDPYRYFTWVVTYGTIYPLGTPQQGILINGQFPGPRLDCVTNDNLIVNVINKLDEPFLITWNGIKQRKNSWQDGVLGTNCPIPPGGNYTYKFQSKDQIGTYMYFPSTAMHRAVGGFGALNVYKRAPIPLPYDPPAGDFTMLIGDWYNATHKALRQTLDAGFALKNPDALLINGVTKSTSFTGDQGKTYLFRVSNIGLLNSINFRIQGHKLRVVEVEGSHVIQNFYDNLDIHVGQSIAFLVTLDQAPKDYYIVASTRYTRKFLTASGVLHYSNSKTPVSGPMPNPTLGLYGSMQQARTFRWNLTANAARPNPQGSYHYGNITRTRQLVFASSAPIVNSKQRYAVNGVTYVVPDTPPKLADNFNIAGVFSVDNIPSNIPSGQAPVVFATSVLRFNLHDFIEIVFQNTENTMQSWHLDGYDFWVVGYGAGTWEPKHRGTYNLVDATTRHTVQVYPYGWSAILVSLDNQGMWNIRSAMWSRQYLGQQFYIRVWTAEHSYSSEYDMPHNALQCGKARGLH
ncbi:L-ascorbate oxidase homolog [Dioscorea cayenensis subsp. rotundata]|uniref:L-ascorbate oxidase homolog n=1 Tax=Dioscorea cayennensis subsp. rotundata TaxID=55577 RepID=A0AB40CH98_DIOCR|nr:L-ascorbate oxidase homolog [Dioscorea cayenensis subsp. rotundata]